MHRTFLLLIASLATAPAIGLSNLSLTQEVAETSSGTDAPPVRNLIVMIADGYGPASATLARTFAGRPLALDAILVGTCGTSPSTGWITDSAAAGTALACGVKTYNGAIGVDPERRPLGNLLEASERRGMTTGLVTTSRVTHATPACFAAHIGDRELETTIAEQELASGVDVLLGGGTIAFVPLDQGGWREDGRNLLEEARRGGFRLVRTRDELLSAMEPPLLGLFDHSHMDFEIDRVDQPALDEMTAVALELLDENDAGFFLMVEGARIDHAGHMNDAAAHLREILAFDRAVERVLRFAKNDGSTLVVVTADHETGGLTLGRNVDGVPRYDWRPEVLGRVSASLRAMGERVAGGEDAFAVLERFAGLTDLAESERESLGTALATRDMDRALLVAGEMINRRAVVAFTTLGHTAADVLLYATGPGSDALRGHWENDALGRELARVMGFDLEAITKELRGE